MPMQLDLVPALDTSRKAARSTAVALSRARGERMAELAAEKVDYLHAEWCKEAIEKLRELAKRTYPGMFSIETARLALDFPVPVGGDLRVWGRVTTEALRLGYIERVPNKWERAASSNGAPKGMYRKGLKA